MATDTGATAATAAAATAISLYGNLEAPEGIYTPQGPIATPGVAAPVLGYTIAAPPSGSMLAAGAAAGGGSATAASTPATGGSGTAGTPATTAAQAYPMAPSGARLSVASVRYAPAKKDKAAAAAAAAALAAAAERRAANDDGTGSDASTAEQASSGGSGQGASHHRAGARPGPILECVLAAQGIDAPASQMTGGAGPAGAASWLPPLACWSPTHAFAVPLSRGEGSSAAAAVTSPTSGQGTAIGAVPPTTKDKAKSTKPKNSMKQTSSSFVQRMSSHNDVQKILAARTEGEPFFFLSSGKTFFWMADLSGKIKEPLARITFSSPITAHDVCQVSRSSDRLDVILGFSTGDLLWLEPVSSRYTRFNKGALFTDSAVTQVRWLPGSESLFMTSHADGTMLVLDRDRDDAPAGSWAPLSMWSTRQAPAASLRTTSKHPQPPAHDEEQEVLSSTDTAPSKASTQQAQLVPWDSRTSILVTVPGTPEAQLAASLENAQSGKEGKKKEIAWAKHNPVSHWRVSNGKINDFAFSPDFPQVAIASDDGLLRLVDIQDERLEVSFSSYFGGFNCVAWSPDGRFLLTGSCDDLVTIWAPREGRIIARCPGHASFVRDVTFDPWRWRVDDRTYRFVSVGEDNKLILWDFSSAALHRPKVHGSGALAARRTSMGSQLSLGLGADAAARRSSMGGRRTSMGLDRLDLASNGVIEAPTHEAPPRGAVAELQPVAVYSLPPPVEGARDDLLSYVRCRQEGIVLLHRSGTSHLLARPEARPPPPPAPRASMSASRRTEQVWSRGGRPVAA